MKLRKLLPCLLALAAIPAFADATTAVAKKVGPVSLYGALGSANGKVISSKTNQPVILRGMSWFWSDATGSPYYSNVVLDWATDNLKIDVIRFAMGINYYDDKGSNKMIGGYASAPEGYAGIIDEMIAAAIENDIYIILDWHSHLANQETAIAKNFFSQMAQKYGKIPNVIFEIFNEPTCSWGEVANYANQVIPGIRANSENLVVVGNSGWSSNPQEANGLSYTNLAYALHFYAGSHPVSGYGGNATQAMNAGKAVFVTEYGTVNYDGAGSANGPSTNNWFDYMDQNMISSCNWSLRQVESSEGGKTKKETSAFFDGSTILNTKALLSAATPSASGAIVKQYLVGKGRSWADSLVKGKNTGACAFKAFSAGELDGSVASKLATGCTYTSSNPAVVANDGTIVGSGFSVMTGNDGSQSVVTITGTPAQQITNFSDLTCNYSGSCSSNRSIGFTADGMHEWIITTDTKTQEGSTFTLTSLNPEIVTVKKAVCATASCSNAQSNKQAYMYEFKSFGTAKVVATAPAITGYKAMNDTILVTFNKGTNNINPNNFKRTKLALGATAAKLLPATAVYENAPVTYTFNGQPTTPYGTVSGTAFTAGMQNAIIRVFGSAPETEHYNAISRPVNVIIGDSATAVNLAEFNTTGFVQTNPKLPIQATIFNNQLDVVSDRSGDMKVEVFSVNGKEIMSKSLSGDFGSMSLADIPNGSYQIIISQGVRQLTLKWNKTSK